MVITLEGHVFFRYSLLHLDENRIFGPLRSNSWRTFAQRGKTVRLCCCEIETPQSWHADGAANRILDHRDILGAFAKLAKCLLTYPLPPARPSVCVLGTIPEPWNGFFWILILGAFYLYSLDIFILDVQFWHLWIRYCVIRQSHAFHSCLVFGLWKFLLWH
jgi:hypothetical protein